MATSRHCDPSDVERYGLHLGTDTADGETQVYLTAKWWLSHMLLVGPTNSGKSRFLVWLFRQLLELPDATLIVLSPKGDLIPMMRDVAIGAGYTKRLVLVDPGDPDCRIGYDPLRPNGLSVHTHAKALRECVRSAYAGASFDIMPQLARFLFLALAAVREREGTLSDAVSLLRPHSPVRAEILETLEDPFLLEALVYFDSLTPRRQDELASSTLARLESFVCDPIIRRMLTSREHSLDLDRVICKRQVLLINLEKNRPLRTDDVKLLGRFLLNDVFSHVFARERGNRAPVFVLIDEAQTFATPDLAIALDQGRELGLGLILAHQNDAQLVGEDGSTQLLEAVRFNTRTKIVFGGGWTPSLDPTVEHLFLDRVNPLAVKDEIDGLEIEPVERMKVVLAVTTSTTTRTSLALPESETDGETETEGEGEADMEGHTSGSNDADVDGSSAGESTVAGFTVMPDGEIIPSEQSGQTSGKTHLSSHGTFEADTSSHTISRTHTKGRSHSRTRGRVPSTGKDKGSSQTLTWQPTTGYIKRRVVTSRTFSPPAEQLLVFKQLLATLPQAHTVVKVSTSPARVVRIPTIEPEELGRAALARARERIFSLPYYAPLAVIEQQEAAARNLLPKHEPPKRAVSSGRGRKRYDF